MPVQHSPYNPFRLASSCADLLLHSFQCLTGSTSYEYVWYFSIFSQLFRSPDSRTRTSMLRCAKSISTHTTNNAWFSQLSRKIEKGILSQHMRLDRKIYNINAYIKHSQPYRKIEYIFVRRMEYSHNYIIYPRWFVVHWTTWWSWERSRIQFNINGYGLHASGYINLFMDAAIYGIWQTAISVINIPYMHVYIWYLAFGMYGTYILKAKVTRTNSENFISHFYCCKCIGTNM